MKFRHNPLSIWLLGVGYFAFYLPYAALTKATTQGYATGGPVSGFIILPVSVLTTALLLYLFATAMGWWRLLDQRQVYGRSIPVPRKASLISGIATAVIIVTTTLAYSFAGISIVFMMVLMRGGVLVIARVTDAAARRVVHWYSAVAMMLTFAALFAIFAENGGYQITLIAALDVAAYLTGYICRFQVMQRITKSRNRRERFKYLTEELAVAMPVLVLGLVLLAIIGANDMMLEVRAGFLGFWTDSATPFAVLIGLCYASLYICGTLIYIDPREYTFCVPVNRASSILSGVAAAYLLAYLTDHATPSGYQFVGAGLLISGLMVLAIGVRRAGKFWQFANQRAILFVCAGNRLRSPIAQALCVAEMARRLGIRPDELRAGGVEVRSAGLTATPGSPINNNVATALDALSVDVALAEQVTQRVSVELIDWADAVYCMTGSQHRELIEMAPNAASKLHHLDADRDIPEPGHTLDSVLEMARQMRTLIGKHLDVGALPVLKGQAQGA